jgi:hypothetical protein
LLLTRKTILGFAAAVVSMGHAVGNDVNELASKEDCYGGADETYY